MENADRAMRNFSRVSSWHEQVTEAELNYIIENYNPNCIFCNGRLRKLVIKKITDKYFELTTESL